MLLTSICIASHPAGKVQLASRTVALELAEREMDLMCKLTPLSNSRSANTDTETSRCSSKTQKQVDVILQTQRQVDVLLQTQIQVDVLLKDTKTKLVIL